MEIEVANRSCMDFKFDSKGSSPERFSSFFFSAPSTPFRHSSVSSSSVLQPNHPIDEDFEFDFSGNLQGPSLSAEELFHAGKIRPLTSPFEEPRKRVERRRNRASSFSISEIDNVSVSVSVSQRGNNSRNASTNFSSSSLTKGYRKWRFKDFLLFRSASEGRATEKDPLRKYSVFPKTTPYEEVRRNSSLNSGSVSRRREPVSAHELHYMVNRAVSEEMKKKTMLPYKQGLLGCCLGFNNPAMQNHHISKTIPSSSLERSS